MFHGMSRSAHCSWESTRSFNAASFSLARTDPDHVIAETTVAVDPVTHQRCNSLSLILYQMSATMAVLRLFDIGPRLALNHLRLVKLWAVGAACSRGHGYIFRRRKRLRPHLFSVATGCRDGRPHFRMPTASRSCSYRCCTVASVWLSKTPGRLEKIFVVLLACVGDDLIITAEWESENSCLPNRTTGITAIYHTKVASASSA
ncbi:hypothetical protein FN846DRAFT_461156 [Sphaerosporella brunnea]|uniref:Uncharacterized protein n=1 Tax=Sphaerosporella brunnea TaxID=1250544 RepID=A0A5J5EEA8_9PEZI|nr:hypothetical protein FN846DRAFT_461156 [Sphaerosporella brunnea]